LLLASIIFTVIFSIVAIIVAYLIRSQVILFDGIYNIVGAGLTLVSFAAMKFIEKKDALNYPFGKEVFEPFIAFIQYGIILYICFSNIVTASRVIFEGGNEVDIAAGMLYGCFSAVYNICIYIYLRFLGKKRATAIVEVEVAQWKFSMFIGVGILSGFSLSWILNVTNLRLIMPYVDPIMTIIVTLAFGTTTISAMKNCVRELLMGKPSEEITKLINEQIEDIIHSYNISDKVIRLGKVGGKVVIEIDYVIEKGSQLDSIAEQDSLRKSLTKALADLPYEKWVNITFTSDGVWTEHDL
jgi:predicted Co/Zn/Cd cation transporter (cation efflux family)